MSKVNITHKEKNYYKYDVPLFIKFSGRDSLYMMVKDVHFSDSPFKLISVNNGHVQTSGAYVSIVDFLNQRPDARIVDVNIEVVYRECESYD